MGKELSFDGLPFAVLELKEQLDRIEKSLLKTECEEYPQRTDFNGALDFLNKIGYPISKSTLQKLSARGDIPSCKFLNRHVFLTDELEEWAMAKSIKESPKSDAALKLAESANLKMKRRKVS